MYPALHVNAQLLPEGREAGQVPSVPLAGADTEHESGMHVSEPVKTPNEHASGDAPLRP